MGKDKITRDFYLSVEALAKKEATDRGSIPLPAGRQVSGADE